MQELVIVTRGSKLALWQAEHIKACIEAQHGEKVSISLKIVKTKGDIILDVPLAKVGGKGLFVKEIEEALLDGSADLAVHSMKDVPMELPEGLFLGAIPEREDPSDTFLSVNYANLDELPKGARVGTCSLRRQSQLLLMRPDLAITNLRGNVDTRLRKLLDNEYDAIIMATSGLKRLGLTAPQQGRLTPPAFLPAVGQGALGIEFAENRQDLRELLAFLDHRPTRICVEAERGFLAGLEGGCQVPIAGFATMTGPDTFTLEGLVASLDGERVIRHTITGDHTNARAQGLALAQVVLDNGAKQILDEVYASGAADK
ncbi:MAG: hydroxymethylbilane synthase [Pseudomonadota bacterium]